MADSLWLRLATTPLDAIAVEEVCGDVGVSRMTFFNYFPSKEHAIDLLLVLFVLRIEDDLRRRGLRGLAALERAFTQLGELCAEGAGRMKRLMGYLGLRPATRPWPVLSPAEVDVVVPALAGDPALPAGLGVVFVRLVEEAIADGLTIVGTPYELGVFLGALYSGIPMVGHSTPDETDWSRLPIRHLRRALGLLGSGGDPPAPRVPKRWRRPEPGA